VDRVKADKGEAAWAVPLRVAPWAPACVRNAGIVNRMNAECPVYRSSARNAGLQW